MTLRGQVMNGVVVFGSDTAPPDGTQVEVTPVAHQGLRASSVLPADVAVHPVSAEQRTALLELIGMWKIKNPPNDEEVERIIEEERMRKYG